MPMINLQKQNRYAPRQTAHVSIALCILLNFFTFFHATEINAQTQTIRVGILLNKSKVALTSTGEVIAAKNGGIQIGNKAYAQSVLELYSPDGSPISIGGRAYRGKITLMRNGSGRINVINELPLEDYLKGVMKMEVHPAWDADALKAQAVVSRTFALFNLKPGEAYDVVATVEDQVYGGINGEDPRTSKAVQETQGQVLIYNGKFASVPFHADCGGFTESSDTVWGGNPVPYLVARPCAFAKETPYRKWEKTFTEPFLRKKLDAAGYNVGMLHSLKPNHITSSGRIAQVLIYHAHGTLKLSGQNFRKAVGYNVLPSTRFKLFVKKKSETISVAELLPDQAYSVVDGYGALDALLYLPQSVAASAYGNIAGNSIVPAAAYVLRQEKTWVFKGSGWGHGVGLSQWDAQAMAQQGYSYQQILSYFYPGTQLTQLSNNEQ